MSDEIRCPECGSQNVDCADEPFHQHRCFDCGHTLVTETMSVDEMAAWLAAVGFGFDFTSDVPLPKALHWPLARAYYLKDADKRDGETVAHYYETLAEECGWPVAERIATPL